MTNQHSGNRGSALILAIGALSVCMLLMLGYASFMQVELDSANFELRKARARAIAEGGINAAIASLKKAVNENKAAELLAQPQKYTFPAYDHAWDGTTPSLKENPQRLSEAVVIISSESGKINLNCAPAAVLQSVFKVNASTAQKIFASVHADNAPQWLTSVNDVVARGLLPAAQLDGLDLSIVTTVSVANPAQPQAYLDVNAANPATLALILGISAETAAQVAAQRPFTTLDAFRQAAGKAPAEFNYKPAGPAPDAMPADFALETRCYRLVCEALYASTADGTRKYDRAPVRAEAVVRLLPGGAFEIAEWSLEG